MSLPFTLRPVARLALASSSRTFATSSAVCAKNPPGRGRDAAKRLRRAERAAKAAASGETMLKKEEPVLGLEDAVRVLQAVEVTRPLAAYELHVVTTVSSHVANALRGRISLPFSARTKPEKLLIFAPEDSAAGGLARRQAAAGEPITVGGAELIADVVSGRVSDFTKVLATPDLVPQIAKALARSLGPKGLMPSAKRGTVVEGEEDMKTAILEAQGAMDWRGDRNGVVRTAVARLNHPLPSLRANIAAFLGAVVDRATSGLGSAAAAGVQQGVVVGAKEPIARSASEMKRAQGVIKQIHLSSTQGPGIKLSLPDVY